MNAPKGMISIVVPAHNESAVIQRALNEVTKGARAGELDVIVVCNGCTDDTAALARQIGPPVRVFETTTANKARALNFGDAQAGTTFPRIYLDADVLMNLEAVRALARRLERGDVLAAAPIARMAVDHCQRLARWYYEIAALLPSARDTGSGVYALSQQGRWRFGAFPDIIADDAYVKVNIKPHECDILASATSTVFKPRTLRDIVRVTTRIKRGHRQVALLFPSLWQARQSNNKAILALGKRLRLWPKLALYCCVVLTAQICACWPVGGRPWQWQRDETTRRGEVM